MRTKRIVLNLTSAEYEQLYRAVNRYRDEVFAREDEYPGQCSDVQQLLDKLHENYQRNGCP